MYFGHWGTGYYDPACFPSSTTDAGESAWAVYYFKSPMVLLEFIN